MAALLGGDIDDEDDDDDDEDEFKPEEEEEDDDDDDDEFVPEEGNDDDDEALDAFGDMANAMANGGRGQAIAALGRMMAVSIFIFIYTHEFF